MSRRIDLDGVALRTPHGRVLCILRFRTTKGLVVHLPESTDVLVPWTAVDAARLDLASGQLEVRFGRGASRPGWLGAWDVLTGRWTDREEIVEPPPA